METTNNIKISLNLKDNEGNDMVVNIILNDECNNGREDFAITGTVWEKGKKRIDKNIIKYGAIGDYIVENFKEFELIYKLHLSQFDGVPMFPIYNGFYFLENKNYGYLKNLLRLTDEELESCKKVNTKIELYLFIKDMGIVERWQNEANEAIRFIENLSGKKFVSSATNKRNFNKYENQLKNRNHENI